MALTGILGGGLVIRQSFISEANGLKSVSLFVSTYQRMNRGVMTVEIRKGSCVIGSTRVNLMTLSDNSWVTLDLSCALMKEVEYEIVITSRVEGQNNGVTLHIDGSESTGLSLSSKKVKGILRHRLEFEHRQIDESVYNPVVGVEEFLKEDRSKLSVVIPTRDRPDLIGPCIENLLISAGERSLEVIIADTGSRDPKVFELYDRWSSDERFKIVMGCRYHYSKLNNDMAKRYATGGTLLFLNNDVFLSEGSISDMEKWMSVYLCGSSGVRLISRSKKIDHDGQVLVREGSICTPDHLNVTLSLDEVEDSVIEVDGVTAACMMTRRSLFLALGGFDEGYKDVYQDCDYALKLRSSGFTSVVERQNYSVHIGSSTRGSEKRNPTITSDRERYMTRWASFEPQSFELTVTTCCTNLDQYVEMIMSVGFSNIVEFNPVDNRGNRFTVTQALNMAKFTSAGRYRVHCHQDILFTAGFVPWFLKRVANQDGLGVIGFEGIKAGGTPWSCRYKEDTEVQTLDELCLIEGDDRLWFDERFKFHYYGADICMEARKLGLKNRLLGFMVDHRSNGKENILRSAAAFKSEASVFREKWSEDVWTTTTKFLGGKIEYLILPRVLNKEDS